MVGIYKITNIVNGRFYIGQSTHIERRFDEHMFQSASRFHNPLFKQDIEQYGKSSFRIDVICECSENELKILERKYIHELNPPYNSVVFGGKRNEEFCLKVKEKTKEWWLNLDDETKRKIISENLKRPPIGHPVSDSTKEKLRQLNLGKKQSKETIQKRVESMKKRYAVKPKDGSGSFKKVGCDVFEEPFESVKSCAKYFGVNPSTVSAALRNGHNVKGHKVWYAV